MKLYQLLLIFIIINFSFASCIKDEPKYREADIVTFRVDDDLYVESVIKETSILLIVGDDADVQNLAIYFTLSEGAQCNFKSGEKLDFTNSQIFKVIAEDSNYTKEYTVSVVKQGNQVGLKYSFDDWVVDKDNSNIRALNDPLWSDANIGVRIAAALYAITQFPTDSTDDCVAGGSAALLQTIKGGKIFLTNYNIFAGSLLYGKFEPNIVDALKSLKLGQKFPEGNGKPTFFTGYYKYFPGPVFTDSKGKEIADKQDEMSMYAAIFKVPKGREGDDMYLDGHTIMTSTDVIARAEWVENGENIVETEAINGYKHFSIPFVYKEDFDYINYNYKLTMVFSSSKDGNLYEGAIGSKLYVDEVEILVE